MKKNMLLFVLLTLTKLSVSAQEAYPKAILINKDTLIAYKPWQVKYINDVYVVGLRECDALKKHYLHVIDSSAEVVTRQAVVVDDLRDKLRLTNNLVTDLRASNLNAMKQVDQLESKGKWSGYERNILGVAVAVLVAGMLLK